MKINVTTSFWCGIIWKSLLILICVTGQLQSAAITEKIADKNDQNEASLMTSNGGGCKDPHHKDLHSSWVAQHQDLGLHPSWYLLPGMRQDISEDLARSREMRSFHVGGTRNVNCDVFPGGDLNSPLQDRSLCPWYHVINHDPSRYPTDLVEAKCSCEHCAGLGDRNSVCQPMYYSVPVQRRTGRCASNVAVWEAGWQELAIGCTCARKPSN